MHHMRTIPTAATLLVHAHILALVRAHPGALPCVRLPVPSHTHLTPHTHSHLCLSVMRLHAHLHALGLQHRLLPLCAQRTTAAPTPTCVHGPAITQGIKPISKIIVEDGNYIYFAKDGIHTKIVKESPDGKTQNAFYYAGEISEYGKITLKSQKNGRYLVSKK